MKRDGGIACCLLAAGLLLVGCSTANCALAGADTWRHPSDRLGEEET
ncbi:MAG TPA: hypothetical protein VMT45_02595 [Thermoanaerobaculaceae bacterium]|jgi:hypothetical protein|nr:hypothetical protein [Thermoanaerobaculaceae bacterium]